MPEKRGPTEILLGRKAGTDRGTATLVAAEGIPEGFRPGESGRVALEARSESVSVVFSRPVALLVFFSAAAGAGVVASDFVVASLNSLRCDWFFSAIEDEWGVGA